MRLVAFLLFVTVVAAERVDDQQISRLIAEISRVGPVNGKMEVTAQCLERVCIGGAFAASNELHLRELGITHVVSAIGEPPAGRVAGITYLVLNLYDAPWQPLTKAFEHSHEFIVRAFATREDARVLVHCAAGISRSASLVIHHLMRANGWTYEHALSQLRAVRPVVEPNSGFERQLRAVYEKLKDEM